jgi:hypothetical protein
MAFSKEYHRARSGVGQVLSWEAVVGHPFVPTLLLVWALSMALRACGVTAATLPPERQATHPTDPMTETRPVAPKAPSARG